MRYLIVIGWFLILKWSKRLGVISDHLSLWVALLQFGCSWSEESHSKSSLWILTGADGFWPILFQIKPVHLFHSVSSLWPHSDQSWYHDSDQLSLMTDERRRRSEGSCKLADGQEILRSEGQDALCIVHVGVGVHVGSAGQCVVCTHPRIQRSPQLLGSSSPQPSTCTMYNVRFPRTEPIHTDSSLQWCLIRLLQKCNRNILQNSIVYM